MGGIITLILIMAPTLLACDIADAAREYIQKRRFQRKMQARRGCNYTYN